MRTQNAAVSYRSLKAPQEIKPPESRVVHGGGFPDFNRVNAAVSLNYKVHFALFLVGVITDGGLGTVMNMRLNNHRYCVGFQYRPRHSAFFKNFRVRPLGEKAAEPCIHEIELGCFKKPLGSVFEIWLQHCNKFLSPEDVEPGFDCRFAYSSIF